MQMPKYTPPRSELYYYLLILLLLLLIIIIILLETLKLILIYIIAKVYIDRTFCFVQCQRIGTAKKERTHRDWHRAKQNFR